MLNVFIIRRRHDKCTGLIWPLGHSASHSSTWSTNEQQLTSAGTTPGIRMSTEKLLELMRFCCGLVADTQSVWSETRSFSYLQGKEGIMANKTKMRRKSIKVDTSQPKETRKHSDKKYREYDVWTLLISNFMKSKLESKTDNKTESRQAR